MNVDHTLAKVLWSFSLADGGATAIMRDLSRHPLLTAGEQEFAGGRLRREETAHANLSAAWARKLGVPRAPGYDPYSAIALRDTMVIRRVAGPLIRAAWTLAGLRWNEEQSVRAFPRWVRLMGRLGFRDMARDFTQLVGEEQTHVDFGLAVARRLADAHPAFDPAYQHYRRLTKHAGVGILQAAFSGPLARLEQAV